MGFIRATKSPLLVPPQFEVVVVPSVPLALVEVVIVGAFRDTAYLPHVTFEARR